MFACEQGFIWHLAQEMNALVVFGEHRYYGESMPSVSSKSTNGDAPANLAYLSSQQALADYAYLLDYVKSTFGAQQSAVVAFGGSYGGMLAAYFRMKYPNVVVGAIAASAPILVSNADCNGFLDVVTNTFAKADARCPDIVRSSWQAINELSLSDQGLQLLTDTFQLCEPLKSSADAAALKDWLNEAYGDLTMSDYPYPTNFLNPLPAWPVKVSELFAFESARSPKVLSHVLSESSQYHFLGSMLKHDGDNDQEQRCR